MAVVVVVVVVVVGAAAAAAAVVLQLLLKRHLPDGKTPWHGRTEKHENCAQKMPNVTSETARK